MGRRSLLRYLKSLKIDTDMHRRMIEDIEEDIQSDKYLLVFVFGVVVGGLVVMYFNLMA